MSIHAQNRAPLALMADFQVFDGGRYEVEGKVNVGTTGTAITASATANVKGAYVQLVASTGFHACGIVIPIIAWSAVQNALMDIAVGAAGSEVDVLPNILLHLDSTARTIFPPLYFPVQIPAATSVSARIQSSVASATVTIVAMLYAWGLMPPSNLTRSTAYGALTASSRGTSVDPGGTANTKGAWVELVASTANPIRSLSVLTGRTTVAALATARHALDIGVGAAGAEVVVIPDLMYESQAVTHNVTGKPYCQLPLGIPAGTRLVARDQSNNITVGDREIDVMILGHD